MDRKRYALVREIFHAASRLPDEERPAYLSDACAGDPEALAEVKALLAADSEAGAFLDSPAVSLAGATVRTTSEAGADMIGPYRLLEVIGSGGMGVVYLAEQSEPVRRRVAVKLIKAGMDTEQVIARFEAERQALAMMDHPGIARVLDAGATDDGRPFFVMELVRGIPITSYCSKNDLALRDRLELFAKVCDALQHAHQKGIIHRDIKPTNVLVESANGDASPKIIDFGVAKATHQQLTERTLHTVLGEMIGTPEYMSPEQAEMSILDIDTRSDIYSMGVLLYELLSGALPFDSSAFRTGGFAEIRSVLVEDEPPRPSTRLSASESDDEIDTRSLMRELKGDLDWVVMKAIAKDRTRRYQSASELAADVRRYLADEPVLASAPSTAYRVRKFVRRHRTAVTGAAAGLVLLVAGVVATTTQAVRATRAEKEARTQAALAADVNEFLVAMLGEANPANHPSGRQVTVVEAVETAARLLDAGDRAPRLEAEVRRVVGEAFLSLARHQEAEAQTRAALEMLQRLDPTPAGEIARLRIQLGVILLDRGDADGARQALEAAKMWFQAAGPAHTLDAARACRHLADAAKTRGDLVSARALYEECLAGARAVDSEDASLLEAKALIKLSVLDREELDLDSAERMVRQGLNLQRGVLGDVHPIVTESLRELAAVLSEKGDLDQADELFRQSLEATRRVYGEGHIRTAVALHNFGLQLLKRKPAAAETHLTEAVEVLESLDLGNEAALAHALDGLAAAEMDLKRYQEAESSFQRALELRRRSLPADHPDIALSLNNLASLYSRTGRHDEAETMFRQALERFRSIYGDAHPRVAVATYNLGSTQSDAGRPVEALPTLRAALDLAATVFPAGHVNLAVMQSKYGLCLVRLGRYSEAESVLNPAYATIRDQLGEDHWRSQEVASTLSDLYARWGKREQSESWREKGAP